jgi:hypothetical protein
MKYEMEIADADIQALEHFVPNAKEWIDTAIRSKVESCKKQLIRKQIEAALENNAPIPSTAADVLAQVFEQKDYKNRAQRIAEDAELPTVEAEREVEQIPVKDDGESATPSI